MSGSKSSASAKRADAPFVSGPAVLDPAQRLQARAEREAAARHEAERLLESKSLELFAANQQLIRLNADLERRVEARTKQLDDARRAAERIGATDHLTGIANRLRYSAQIQRSLARAAAERRAIGLLLIDLDGFKLVNDTYGHHHGDQILSTIAGRLRAMTRNNDLVARIGGDEFAVILDGPDAAAVTAAARRFGQVFAQSVTISGVTIDPRGSLGLAISPDDCASALDLQRYADLALYKSKKQRDGKLVRFEPEFLHAYEYRQRMEAEFRAAVEAGAIDLVYQPIVCLESGAVEAVEALARWADSAGAEISPSYFIPLAEQCGIIRGVGRSLLERALCETREWLVAGRIERVTFNVSPMELHDEGFPDAVLEVLQRVGVEPCHLLLEITEGAAIHNLELVQKVMNRLRQCGVGFALDDFGCGYFDFSTLRKLPIGVLKIDRSLLVDAEHDPSARVILRHIVSLCQQLGIRSVCEGAETAAQLAFLRSIECHSVQGFACGRPGRPAQVARMLRSPRAIAV